MEVMVITGYIFLPFEDGRCLQSLHKVSMLL